MDKKIKVCFVAENSSEMAGSAQSLANLMIELASHDVVPTLVSHKYSDQIKYANDHGIRTTIIPSIIGVYLKTPKGYLKRIIFKATEPIILRLILNFLQKEKFDVIHMNSLDSSIVWAIAAKKLNIPYVWHLREYKDENVKFKLIDENKYLQIISNADEVIVISKDMQKYYEHCLNRNCCLIYNGFKIDTYYSDCQNKLLDETIKCVIIGRVVEDKRQMDAILAIKKLIKMGYKFHLDIIGYRDSDKYEKDIKKYIECHDLSANINLIPYTYEIRNLIKDSDIGLMCSTREAFGRVTIEYKLAGLLAIGANTGGTPEIIEDGVNGLLYEMGDIENLTNQLLWVANNRLKAKTILQEGQKQAIKEFNIENTANKVLNVYKTVID